jgi:septal ring factor EnvC (AmiA/AmiB activator)
MPKIVFVIIALAFGFVIGLLIGAFLTVPQNKEMEQLIKDKSVIQAKLDDSCKETLTLKEQLDRLRSSNDSLKERLLEASKNNHEDKSSPESNKDLMHSK